MLALFNSHFFVSKIKVFHCTLGKPRPKKAYQKSKVARKFVKKKKRESAKIRAYFEARLTLLPNTLKYEEFIITGMSGICVFTGPLRALETA